MLTNEQKRICIAEACGWKRHPLGMNPYFWIHFPSETQCRHDEALLDYLNDLNAMHEAEKLFINSDTSLLWTTYMVELNKLTFSPTHATAAQRAEAFGRTLNLW